MSLIVYTGAFRFPCGDAASARVLNNAKILRELGYDVLFLSWGRGVEQKTRGCYQGFRYICTDDLCSNARFPISRLFHFFFLGHRALKIMNRPDIRPSAVIIYDAPAYFSTKMLSYCQQRTIPLISDIDEWFDNAEFPGGKFAPPAWLNNWNMRNLQSRIANKIVISSWLEHYYKKNHCILLPPLIDLNELKWNRKDERSNNNCIRLIYAGTPTHKDLLEVIISAVIKAVEAGARLELNILGINESQIESCVSVVKKRVPQFIHFLGKVPQEEVPSYYAKSDFSLLIRPVNRKMTAGFPTKFVESMGAQCPVIATEFSDISYYLKHGENGFLVEDCTEESLCRILLRLNDLSSNQLKIMKKSAYKCAFESFHYYNYLDKMRSFLMSLQ